MCEENKSPRYRVNVARSVKGVMTYDCTAETNDRDKTLEDSDYLFQELEKRYPAPMETGG